MPRGHRLDGNVLRDTPNQIAAKRRRAERTKCSKCGRKMALVTLRDDGGYTVYCQWIERGLCDYAVYRPFPIIDDPAARATEGEKT